MFNLFKKNEDTKENNVSLIAVCSLLIHSAKIDENYTEKEKDLYFKYLPSKKVFKKKSVNKEIKDNPFQILKQLNLD